MTDLPSKPAITELEERVSELETEVEDLGELLQNAIAGGQVLLEWLQAMEVDRLAVLAAFGRRSSTSRDYLRRILAMDARLLDATALGRLGTRAAAATSSERRLCGYAGAVRTWRDAWVQAVGHHLELVGAGPPAGVSDHATWMESRDLHAVLGRLSSPELARDAVATMQGMADHLEEHGSEPEHKEWACALKEWAVLWRRVAMAGPAGECRTWTELTHHPDYVAVCARTTTLELAARIVTTLGGMVAYFSDEARQEAS